MNSDEIKRKILNDIRVELLDEFDKNFERKGFFSRPWQPRKKEGRGSLMLVTGKLRRSIRAQVEGDKVVFTSDMPYASIHNEGGTVQMKPRKQVIHFDKKGKFTKKNSKKAKYAQKASRGAYTLTMPKRQFIGNAPEVQQAIKRVVDDNMKDLEQVIANALKQKS